MGVKMNNNDSNNDTNSSGGGEQKKKTTKPLLGVSVYHLCTIFQPEVMLYVSQSLKRDVSNGITLYDIEDNNNYITNTSAYVETLEGQDHVGEVTHMLSYTWGNTIDDITSSLANYCEMNTLNPKRTYIWLCCLCHNANLNDINGSSSLQEDNHPLQFLTQQIINVNNILVLMVPICNTNKEKNTQAVTTASTARLPLYLSRAWCIYELFVAITNECNIEVIMPPDAKEQIMNTIIKQTTLGFGGPLQDLVLALSTTAEDNTATKVEYANTTRPEDKAAILRLITLKESCHKVNSVVNNFMKEWVDTVMVEETVEQAEYDSFDSSIDMDLAVMYNSIGLVYNNDQGDYDKALMYFHKSQFIHEKVRAINYNSMGDVLVNTQNYEEAKNNYEKSITAQQNMLNIIKENGDYYVDDDTETLLSLTYNNLSLVCYKLGDYSKSLEYAQTCYTELDKDDDDISDDDDSSDDDDEEDDSSSDDEEEDDDDDAEEDEAQDLIAAAQVMRKSLLFPGVQKEEEDEVDPNINDPRRIRKKKIVRDYVSESLNNDVEHRAFDTSRVNSSKSIDFSFSKDTSNPFLPQNQKNNSEKSLTKKTGGFFGGLTSAVFGPKETPEQKRFSSLFGTTMTEEKKYILELETEWSSSNDNLMDEADIIIGDEYENNNSNNLFITALSPIYIGEKQYEGVKEKSPSLLLCTEQSVSSHVYQICMRDIKEGLTLRDFDGHDGWIHSIVALSSTGTEIKNNNTYTTMNTKESCFFLSCSEDCTIKLWNTTDITGQCIGTFAKGHTDAVTTITDTISIMNYETDEYASEEDDEDEDETEIYFLSGSKDFTIKLWNINDHDYNDSDNSDEEDDSEEEDDNCVHTFEGHNDTVNAIAWITTTSATYNAEDFHDTAEIADIVHTTKDVFFVSGSEDNELKLWNLASNSCIYTNYTEHKGAIKCLESLDNLHNNNISSNNGKDASSSSMFYFLSGSEDRTIKLWCMVCRLPLDVSNISATCSVLRTFRGSSSSIHSLSPTIDRNLFLSGSENTIKVWSLIDGTCLSSVTTYDDDEDYDDHLPPDIMTYGITSLIPMTNSIPTGNDDNGSTASSNVEPGVITVCSTSFDKSFKVWRMSEEKES